MSSALSAEAFGLRVTGLGEKPAALFDATGSSMLVLDEIARCGVIMRLSLLAASNVLMLYVSLNNVSLVCCTYVIGKGTALTQNAA